MSNREEKKRPGVRPSPPPRPHRAAMIRVQADSGDPRQLFRDLWVEVPNYANPKARGTIHACFCPSGRKTSKETRSYLVPRAWALKNGVCGPFVPRSPRGGARAPSGYVFRGSLDADRFQDKAAAAVHRSMAERNSALLCMPCGFGKTVTTLAIFAGTRGAGGGRPRMLVFAHKNFLLSQWEERSHAFLGVVGPEGARDRPVRVGRYQGPKADCDWSKFDIICASLATVARRLSDNDPTASRLMSGSIGGASAAGGQDAPFLVVYDEAHHVPAATWLKTFFCLRARPGLHVLGLSATPRRADGLDVFLSSCFGAPFVDPVPRARGASSRAAKVTVPPAEVAIVRHPHGPQRMPVSRRTGRPDFNGFLQAIVDSGDVTDLIAREAVRQLRDPLTTSILVLSHRVSHIKRIARALPAGSARALYGGQTRAEKAEGHKFNRRVVASTYAYLSEGFDCKKFNVLILATPKKDVEQAIGRIARDRGARWRGLRDAVASAARFASKESSAAETIASLAVNTKSLVVDVCQGNYALRQRRATYAKCGLRVSIRDLRTRGASRSTFAEPNRG